MSNETTQTTLAGSPEPATSSDEPERDDATSDDTTTDEESTAGAESPAGPAVEGRQSPAVDAEGRGQAVEVRPPDDDLNTVYKRHGPYSCPTCGGYSWTPYRCDAPVSAKDGSRCGADLADRGSQKVTRPTVVRD